MPIYENNNQLNASRYFNKTKVNIIPEDIQELEMLIEKKKNTLEFINLIYDECYNDLYISNYLKGNDELIIYEKSEYYVFDTGIHFIRTKDGKYRNWIYAVEINKAYNALQDEIINFQLILDKRLLLLAKMLII
jgi:hypothetical protein